MKNDVNGQMDTFRPSWKFEKEDRTETRERNRNKEYQRKQKKS